MLQLFDGQSDKATALVCCHSSFGKLHVQTDVDTRRHYSQGTRSQSPKRDFRGPAKHEPSNPVHAKSASDVNPRDFWSQAIAILVGRPTMTTPNSTDTSAKGFWSLCEYGSFAHRYACPCSHAQQLGSRMRRPAGPHHCVMERNLKCASHTIHARYLAALLAHP